MNRGKESASSTNDAGKLILRLVLGILILIHGVSKLIAGPAGVVGAVQAAGLPTETLLAMWRITAHLLTTKRQDHSNPAEAPGAPYGSERLCITPTC